MGFNSALKGLNAQILSKGKPSNSTTYIPVCGRVKNTAHRRIRVRVVQF